MISKDVTFDETRMRIKLKDLETLEPQTSVEETQFEAELPNNEKEDVEDQTPNIRFKWKSIDSGP